MSTRVVNVLREECDVYIGRGMYGIATDHGVRSYQHSKWANPFKPGTHGNREQIIEKYRVWIMNQPALLASLDDLRGKKLGCWCFPKPCHGDILIELLDQLDEQ